MREPLIYVLVINWNGREHLEACFDALLATGYTNAVFLLVDNGSTDGSAAFVRERYPDPRVQVLACGGNLGWSGGNNAGIQQAMDAGADYVLLLNNDTAIAPDALWLLVDSMEKCPETGALAPKLVLFDEPDIINSLGLECSIIGAAWDIALGRVDQPKWNHPRRVAGVCGAGAMFRVEALRAAGLLPTDFEIYLDDLDLCLRIWDAGHEIWNCPAAVVRHKFSATMGEGKRAQRKYYLNTRNRFRIVMRNFPLRVLPAAMAALAVGELRAIGRATLDRAWWRVGAHLRAILAAAAYSPEAWRMRRERRRRGLRTGRFYPLVRRRPQFFPGTTLPVNGWYPERAADGAMVRPMARQARLDVDGGLLRLLHVNCYPQLGKTEIVVRQGDRTLGVLSTLSRAESAIAVQPGEVLFDAKVLFEAEATGEPIDLGGWIRVVSCGQGRQRGAG